MLTAALAFLFSFQGLAQSAPAAAPIAKSEAPHAARLAYVQGKVQVSQNGTLLSEQAAINTPLFEGAQLATGDDGQAELQLDDGGLIRLAPNSALTLTVLKQKNSAAVAEVKLDRGLAYFELQSTDSSRNTVRFADATANFSAFTVLRVNLDTAPGAAAAATSAAADAPTSARVSPRRSTASPSGTKRRSPTA